MKTASVFLDKRLSAAGAGLLLTNNLSGSKVDLTQNIYDAELLKQISVSIEEF